MRGWNPSANSSDTDVIPKLDSLRASSRDLAMNSPMGAGSLGRYRDFVVGHGLYLQCRIDSEILGLTPEEATAWSRNTEREWRLHAESTDIDAARTSDFYGLQALTYISKLASGDVFWIPLNIPRKGSVYDLRIRVLEADMVSNPNNQMDTETLAGGVEVDELGAPVAYHMSKKHPGSLNNFGGNTWQRIPVFAPRTGFRQVYHTFDKTRPGQRRGVPLFAPVVETLKQVTRLTEAELMAALVSSFFTVFVKTETGDGLGPSFDDDESVRNPDDKNTYEIGSGNVIDLAEREAIEIADPKRPNSNYAPFFEALAKQVGAAINMPAEVIFGLFTSSYSAARAALLLALKSSMIHRMGLSREFCQPAYERWLLEAVLKDRIVAPGFIENPILRKAWCGSRWQGQALGQLNPVVETKAALMRVDGKISTREKEVAQIDGDDWDTMFDVAVSEQERINKEFPAAPVPVAGMKDPDFNNAPKKQGENE